MVPFQRFAVAMASVTFSVKKASLIKFDETKLPHYNHLRFRFCTGLLDAIAPIVCVDFYRYSGNFASSTVERVGTITLSQSKVD